MTKTSYYAATTGEGCPHDHRLIKAATKCAKKMKLYNKAISGRKKFGVYKREQHPKHDTLILNV